MSNTILIAEINKRINLLKSVLDSIDQFNGANNATGRLRISQSNGRIQYYHVTEKSPNCGNYIRKEDYRIAQDLAQKDYSSKLASSIRGELLALEILLKIYSEDSPEIVYDKLQTERKKLINPLIVSDEKYEKIWIEEEYEVNQYRSEELKYETKRGEFVRSKSEMMIADLYYEMHIPYRYECKITFPDGIVKYPDFMLLDAKKQKIIYHEHMGLIDDEDYRNASFKKLELYQKNDIYIGKNLILTFESESVPFNIHSIKRMIKSIMEE